MIEKVLERKGEHKIVRSLVELSSLDPTPVFAIDIETFGDGKLPGDNPYSDMHGIAGIAIANAKGDARYLVVADGACSDPQGESIPLEAVIEFLNNNWFCNDRVAVLHNCKFDLGFLTDRGLNVTHGVRIHDTWIVNSLLSRGVFKSNKLKDIMKEKFNLDVDTESEIKKWLTEHKTMDYGLVPVEKMAPYACDDVRYTLALYFSQVPLPEWVKEAHDRYFRNSLALIAAESRGICFNRDAMMTAMTKGRVKLEELRATVTSNLGGTEIDLDDEQQVMKYLHNRKLHSEPREMYGERKYFLDEEFLRASKHPLAESYLHFAKLKAFLHNFSAKDGVLNGRMFQVDGCVGVHPSYQVSVFAKGGLVFCRKPDFQEGVRLRNEIRALFQARPGKVFRVIRVCDLAAHLLSFYCTNKDFQNLIGSGGQAFCEELKAINNLSVEINSLCLRKIIEGSGFALLGNRLNAAGITVAGKRQQQNLQNAFEAAFTGYAALNQRLGEQLNSNQGLIIDRTQRQIVVPEDKRWRALAMLLNSSMGSIISMYFDYFNKLAEKTGANLVFAHEKEFLFEIPVKDSVFDSAIGAFLQRPMVEPHPKWLYQRIEPEAPWKMPYVDAHDLVVGKKY